MIAGPFLELYVAAQLAELDRYRELQHHAVSHKTPKWAQWFARALVRIAAWIGGEQVRIEWPAARA